MLYYPFHRMSSRFTAEGENARRKNGRIKDKSVRNVPGPIKEADKEKLYYAEWRASCL